MHGFSDVLLAVRHLHDVANLRSRRLGDFHVAVTRIRLAICVVEHDSNANPFERRREAARAKHIAPYGERTGERIINAVMTLIVAARAADGSRNLKHITKGKFD